MMRILRITLHSLFLLMGVGFLIEPSLSEELNNLLVFALFIYAAAALSISVLKEVLLVAFPRHFGVLLVFVFLFFKLITKSYDFFERDLLIGYLTIFAVLLAGYFLVTAIIGIKFSFKLKKIRTSSYRNLYWPNYIIFFLLIGAFVFFVYSLIKEGDKKAWYYSLAILLALFPHFNRNLIRYFGLSLKSLTSSLNLDISFNQIGKLAKIRNFVFLKDKLMESGDYQVVDADYRSTIRVITALQLSLQLSEDWNKKYSSLFVRDDYQKIDISYDIVEKNNEGITVIDDNAVMYHFGNYSYVKDKLKNENKANLFLLKNELPIAKYTVNEKISNEKAELVNQLDYFGNTILFNARAKEDLGRDDGIVFDRVYSGLTEQKQHDLLKELNKKAPTAFFSAKNPENSPNDLSFYVTTKTGVKTNQKLAVCNSTSLLKIPRLIKHVKKVHTFLRYALFSSLAVQLVLIVFAILNYKSIVLILAFNIGFAILSELVLKLFSKKLIYWPDQPDNLAHNHQAA